MEPSTTPSPTDNYKTSRLPMPNYPDTVGGAWAVVGMLIVFQVVTAIPFAVAAGAGKVFGWTLPGGIGETLGYGLAFGSTIWFALRKRGNRRLAFGPVSPASVPVVIVGTVALIVLIEAVTSLIPSPDWLTEMMKKMFTKDLILSAVLLAPVLEEIVFRGIILDGLLKRQSPVKAILWSAALFGFVHLNPVQSVGAMILGIALGWVYYRTGSLWLCILIHFVNNGLASLPLLLDDKLDMSANSTLALVGGSMPVYGAVLVACVGVVGGCYMLLNRLLPKP